MSVLRAQCFAYVRIYSLIHSISIGLYIQIWFERIIYHIQCIALFGKNHNQPSLAQRHPKTNFPPLYGAQVAVVLQCPFANLHFFYLNARLHHGVHRGNWLKSTIKHWMDFIGFHQPTTMFDLTLLNLAYHWVCCTALPKKNAVTISKSFNRDYHPKVEQ